MEEKENIENSSSIASREELGKQDCNILFIIIQGGKSVKYPAFDITPNIYEKQGFFRGRVEPLKVYFAFGWY